MAPQNVYNLTPKTCEYVTFYDKRYFANVIKVRISSWGVYPGLTRWVLIRKRNKLRKSQLRKHDDGRSERKNILIHLGTYNKIPEMGWHINSRNFSQLYKLEVHDLSASWLPVVRLASCLINNHLLTVSSHGGMVRDLSGAPFIKGLISFMRVPSND